MEKSILNFTDNTTNATTVIDYSRYKTHVGDHFKAGYQDTDMTAGDKIEIVFVTPDTSTWAHWSLQAQATGSVVVQLFEGSVLVSNGAAITRLNRNRNSLNTSKTLAYHSPTITSDGTKLSEKWVGSEGWRSDISGSFASTNHFLLKQNTTYLLRLTALSSGIKGGVGGDWSEHSNE